MGPKNSKSPPPIETTPKSEEIKEDSKDSSSPPKVVTRDIRNQYLSRMGFG